MNNPKLISACLLGIKCRWDGKYKPCQKAIDLAKKECLMPVCPEQLGGLPTPRIPQEIQKDGRVLNKQGKDVTANFKRGAEETLKIAKILGVKEFIGKSKSPSCGFGELYDGTFSDTLTKGNGITTDLLLKNNIKVITEEDF